MSDQDASGDNKQPEQQQASSSSPARSSSPHSSSITNLVAQQFQQTMKRAFWDLMYEQLSSNPPNLDTAFQLLHDVRTGLHDLLPRSRKTTMHEQLDQIFNFELLREHAEKNCVDIPDLLQKVLVFMQQMCAPARDDKLKEITENLSGHDDSSDHARNLVSIFKSVLEFIDLMNADYRKILEQNTNPVDLHRAQFQAYLNSGGHPEVLISWLRAAKQETLTTQQVYTKAICNLLTLQVNQPMPETIIDEHIERCRFFSIEMQSVALLTAILLLAKQVTNQTDISALSTAIRGILTDPGSGSTTLNNRLENVISYILDKHSLSEHASRSLKSSISELGKSNAVKEHPVLKLVMERNVQFCCESLGVALQKQQTFPQVPGVVKQTGTANDLLYIAQDFIKISLQNFMTFEHLYTDMLGKI